MRPHSLYGRSALIFAVILVALGVVLSWQGYSAAKRHQHAVLQRVNFALAANIAAQPIFMEAIEKDAQRTDALFAQLMAVNPNIEAYLLDSQGKVLHASSQNVAHIQENVALGPIRALLNDAALPVLDDNPRHAGNREIFSVAPVRDRNGITKGYVYIVLLNDMYRDMVGTAWRDYVLRSAVWIAAVAMLVALAAGLGAFAFITRRLQRVTNEVEAFATTPTGKQRMSMLGLAKTGDEIDRLSAAFASMRERLLAQMVELKHQDELRRELIANVSHDLRTPLTSMQGYLETLARMDLQLSREEQKQYLDVAVRQSHRVSHLAQQLFELARLECEETLPQPELFCMSELIQDIAQKYALATEQKDLQFSTQVDNDALFVQADIGMIERVISNLLDNAIRHTPERGEIQLRAFCKAETVEVCISDNGQGISPEHLPGLLQRGSPLRQIAIQRGGGLGLLIANRILSLHGSRIHAISQPGKETHISFILPMAQTA